MQIITKLQIWTIGSSVVIVLSVVLFVYFDILRTFDGHGLAMVGILLDISGSMFIALPVIYSISIETNIPFNTRILQQRMTRVGVSVLIVGFFIQFLGTYMQS